MKLRSIAIAAAPPLVVAGLWVSAVVLPTGNSADDLQDRLDATDAELVDLALVLEDSRSVDSQLASLNTQLDDLTIAVPPTPDIAGFVRLVHALADQSGTLVSSVTPQVEQDSSVSIGSQVTTVSLSLEGDYSAIMAFVDDLLDADRLVQIDSVDLAADSSAGSLFVELVVSIYSESGSSSAVGDLFSQADQQVDDATAGLTLEADG